MALGGLKFILGRNSIELIIGQKEEDDALKNYKEDVT